MATSPNYGWSEPDNTSLVKDGAQAMRTLGDAIDTSLWNSGYGQAGKNKIINGDFGIWQRGTSFTPAAGASFFSADRFNSSWSGTGTSTFSRQTFTPGTAPVAGYEGSFYLRSSMSSGATYLFNSQKIEDVRTFAGQTVTLSFWAKSSSTFTTRPIIRQAFGSGGSANVDANLTDTTFTTSWARYSWTTTLASIAGKTIGTGSSLIIFFINYQTGTIASNDIDIWGVQVEAGSKATPFQTASGGSIQGELAMCQRYFERSTFNNSNMSFPGFVSSTTTGYITWTYKTTKRGTPTITLGAAATDFAVRIQGGVNAQISGYSIIGNTFDNAWISATTSGLTAGDGCFMVSLNSNSYLEASSEL